MLRSSFVGNTSFLLRDITDEYREAGIWALLCKFSDDRIQWRHSDRTICSGYHAI
jgi:hypothetical protein